MADLTPGATDLGFSLIPPDEDAIAPADDLASAAASALADDPGTPDLAEDPPEPYGVSWRFDYDAGRFVRQGTSPTPVSGLAALIEWCMVALNSARFTHPIFSDEFGVEHPDRLIGQSAPDEALSDYEAGIRAALLVHDRIVDVTDFDMTFDPTTGILTVERFTVVTDQNEEFIITGTFGSGDITEA